MSRIDVYIKNLYTHQAQSLVLQGGQMIMLHFASGQPRSMKKACTDEEILALATDVMPPEAATDLAQNGSCEFPASAENYGKVTVHLSRPGGRMRCELKRPGAAHAPAAGSDDGAGAASPASSGAAPPQKEDAGGPGTGSQVAADSGLLRLLKRAFDEHASDLHLRGGEQASIRIGTLLRPLGTERPTPQVLASMVAEILDTTSRQRLERRGWARVAVAVPNAGRARIHLCMERRGWALSARLQPDRIRTPEEVGIPPPLRAIMSQTRGLVLLAGGAGSGRSTTRAALVEQLAASREVHAVVVEETREFTQGGRRGVVTALESGPDDEPMAAALRAAVLQDADVVVADALVGPASLMAALETAEAGKLLVGVVHGTSVSGALERIIDSFSTERQGRVRALLADHLRVATAQVLVTRPGGSRQAVFEVLVGAQAVTNLVREGRTYQLDAAIQAGRKDGMWSLNDALYALVVKKTLEPAQAWAACTERADIKALLAKVNWQPESEV